MAAKWTHFGLHWFKGTFHWSITGRVSDIYASCTLCVFYTYDTKSIREKTNDISFFWVTATYYVVYINACYTTSSSRQKLGTLVGLNCVDGQFATKFLMIFQQPITLHIHWSSVLSDYSFWQELTLMHPLSVYCLFVYYFAASILSQYKTLKIFLR